MDPVSDEGLRPWTPIRISGPPRDPVVEWAFVSAPFTQPFFEQSAHVAMESPFNLAFARRTPLAAAASSIALRCVRACSRRSLRVRSVSSLSTGVIGGTFTDFRSSAPKYCLERISRALARRSIDLRDLPR